MSLFLTMEERLDANCATMYDHPFRCMQDCADFRKGQRKAFAVVGSDGKASQPQQWPGRNVKARCSHEAYYLGCCQFTDIGPVREISVKPA